MADPRHYVVTSEDGEARLLDPFGRLVAMLEAFERKMAMQDRRTYEIALKRLSRDVRGEGVQGAIFEPARDEGREFRPVDLEAAPDLQELRGGVRSLIGRLFESRRPPTSFA